MSEGEIQKAIIAAFTGSPVLALWRTGVGAFRVGDRFVRVGLKGSADLTGVLSPTGRAVFIEVKAERGRQSPEQKAFQRLVEKYGGLYVLARDVDTVRKAVGL